MKANDSLAAFLLRIRDINRVVASAIIINFACLVAPAAEYSTSGEIEVTTKVSASDEGQKRKLGFYVEVLGANYKVRITESPEQYFEYAFEGRLMYLLHHITNTRPANLEKAKNPPSLFPAQIEFRDFPPNDGTRAQFVWFALASHNFFKNLTNNVMLPIWSPEDPKIRVQPLTMAIAPELLSELPHLPRRVSFLNDGFYRTYSPVTKSLEVRPLVPPYDRGYTNAYYEVLAITNTPRYTLPSQFVFTVYSSPLGSNPTPFERVTIRGSVHSVSEMAPEGAKTKSFSGLASVVDFRLNDHLFDDSPNYGSYYVTNGIWKTPDQIAKIQKTQKRY